MSKSFFTSKKHDSKVPKRPESYKKNIYQNKVNPNFRKLGGGVGSYQGAFGRAEIKHLLSRTMFGYTRSDIDFFEGKTLDQALDILLQYESSISPPVNNYNGVENDPDHALGETWINGPLKTDTVNFLQIRSFQDWTFGKALNQERSIQEKMTLFWHNHFATQTSGINFSQIIYRQHDIFRRTGLGNFKEMLKAITLDPGMMIYLNGFKNQKNAPDENYARELQELFTLGVDSGYTESDVQEAARLLTGWTITQTTGETFFEPSRHDTGNKTFSAFYNNQVIAGGNDGEAELDQLLDMICSKEDVSKYICRKLYRFFVYYVIDENIESTIIEPLADTFRANNYDILPVLRQLFKSEHFFDEYARGAMIKNPIDYYVSLHKLLETDMDFGGDFVQQYNVWDYNFLFGSISLMEYGNPPNVAGWEAYWNGPAYHELWINSATLPFRNQLADATIYPGALTVKGSPIFADVIAYTETVPNAEDPNVLVDYVVELFHPNEANAVQKAELKALLLSGQAQDYYWTFAWQDYLADKTDEVKKQAVFFRLFSFFKKVMNMAEFQLS